MVDELTSLLLAARDGDRLALAAAIRLAQAEVWRLAAHLVGAGDADDIAQDTFVRAWRSLPTYRGDASGRTWLLVIARRACADAIRQRSRQRRLGQRLVDHADRSSTGGTVPDPGGVELTELVMALAPARREAFVLTQVLGCSYAETAQICRVPVGTVRSRVARARDDLVIRVRAAETA